MSSQAIRCRYEFLTSLLMITTRRANEPNFRFGSWPCKNAKALNRYRRSYSSKTVSGIQFESAFDLEIELKNVILVAFRFFVFLHSQGHNRQWLSLDGMSDLPSRADVVSRIDHARNLPGADMTDLTRAKKKAVRRRLLNSNRMTTPVDRELLRLGAAAQSKY